MDVTNPVSAINECNQSDMSLLSRDVHNNRNKTNETDSPCTKKKICKMAVTVTSSTEAQFSKEFSFTLLDGPAATLPDSSKWFAAGKDETGGRNCRDGERFVILREELNAVKSKLNRLPLEKWHRHTREVNPAADVVARSEHFINWNE